jgi:acyl dehydratase
MDSDMRDLVASVTANIDANSPAASEQGDFNNLTTDSPAASEQGDFNLTTDSPAASEQGDFNNLTTDSPAASEQGDFNNLTTDSPTTYSFVQRRYNYPFSEALSPNLPPKV